MQHMKSGIVYGVDIEDLKGDSLKARSSRGKAAAVLMRYPGLKVSYENMKAKYKFLCLRAFHDYYNDDKAAMQIIEEVETVERIVFKFPAIYQSIIKQRYFNHSVFRNGKLAPVEYKDIRTPINRYYMQTFCNYVLFRISDELGFIDRDRDEKRSRRRRYEKRSAEMKRSGKKYLKIDKAAIPESWIY